MSKSATPATQHEGRCQQAPRLPQKMKVDVKKCHAATPATENENQCQKVPRMPHNMDVDVTKCHACHTKCTLPILTVTSNKWFNPLNLC